MNEPEKQFHIQKRSPFQHTTILQNSQNILHNTESNASDSSTMLVTAASTAQPFNQLELNDMIRELNLSKEFAEVLPSRLNENNPLVPGTKIACYRSREKYSLQYFSKVNRLAWCNVIGGPLRHQSTSHQWFLFIDSSTRSLICVLQHNGNMMAPFQLGI